MVAAYGIVFTVVFAIVCLVGTWGILVKRNHPIIKCRDPFFLITQNLGTLLAATVTSLYMGLRPDFSCYVYYVGQLLAFSVVAYPLFIRCWEYGINFHLSKIRSKFRSNVLLPNWGETSWFVRNRWASRLSFLRKLYFLTFWLWLIPCIPYILIVDEYDYDRVSGGCKAYPGATYISIIFVLMFLAASLFVTVLIWGRNDAYKIKLEMKLVSITWIVVFAIYIPYGSIIFSFQYKLSASFWILMGFYATFIICTIYPLILVRRENVITVGEAAAGFEEFVNQLEFLPFRNAFRDFLALQFCQENILFYENACDWKRMSANDPDRAVVARSIRDNYILESGLCQINISGPAREKIAQAVSEDDDNISNDVFDEALNAVLSNMHANSYYQFKAHHLYISAKA